MISRLLRCVRLRMEQEFIIIRYALWCKAGRLTRFLLVVRPVFILLSIGFMMSTIYGSIYARRVSQQYLNIGLLFVYSVYLFNMMWEKGLKSQSIQKWKQGIVVVIFLQCTSIGALTVIDVTDRSTDVEFLQFGDNVVEVELPGEITVLDVDGLAIENILVIDNIEAMETDLGLDDEEVTDTDSIVDVPLRVIGNPLNYPNPCRLGTTGTTIGYHLTKDADIEIRIYDPFAREITRLNFLSGQRGGKGAFPVDNDRYNHVAITPEILGTSDVPAGIYFYVIIHGDEALARGRIAVLP